MSPFLFGTNFFTLTCICCFGADDFLVVLHCLHHRCCLLVSRFVGRSANACRSRWRLFLSPQIKKGRWSTHEDKVTDWWDGGWGAGQDSWETWGGLGGWEAG